MLEVLSFALQLAKAACELLKGIWKKKASNLDLTDEAKRVLKIMQSDESENGIFVDATGFGTSKLILINLYAEGEITTTRRVITELEAKGVIKIVEEDKIEHRQKKVELTRLGWILNPDTGQADKIG